METISDLKKDFEIILVPTQWRTMLENGIEVDIQNNNLFDLTVMDLCKGRGGNDPKSFIFSFKVGSEEIAFGVKQRTEIVEKIVGYETEEIKEDIIEPTKKGYIFEGWYLDQNFKQEFRLKYLEVWTWK